MHTVAAHTSWWQIGEIVFGTDDQQILLVVNRWIGRNLFSEQTEFSV